MPKLHYDEAEVTAVAQVASLNSSRFDDNESINMAKDLDYLKAKVYEKKTAAMRGLSLVPMANDTPEHAETVTYQMYDKVGMAKIVANYADDLPRSDVAKAEKTIRVRTIGASYGYSFNELNASIKMGTNLPQRKGDTARKSIDVKLNQIAMIGDADYGLHGMTNHPNIGVTVLSGADWTDTGTTADVMTADLEAIYASVFEVTKGVHTPNKLVLASKLYTAAKNKRIPDSNGKTVLSQFLEDYPSLKAESVPEFNDVGGKKLMFIGEFDVDNISNEMVMPFKQLPAQARNLELVVPCLAKAAGVVVHYPMAFAKAEI